MWTAGRLQPCLRQACEPANESQVRAALNGVSERVRVTFWECETLKRRINCGVMWWTILGFLSFKVEVWKEGNRCPWAKEGETRPVQDTEPKVTSQGFCFWILCSETWTDTRTCDVYLVIRDGFLRVSLNGCSAFASESSLCEVGSLGLGLLIWSSGWLVTAVVVLGRAWQYFTWAERPVDPREFEFHCVACLQSESHLTALTWNGNFSTGGRVSKSCSYLTSVIPFYFIK